MNTNNLEEKAKLIYQTAVKDSLVNSHGLAPGWDALRPDFQQKYIDVAQKITHDVLTQYSDTLFTVSSNTVDIIADRDKILQIYKLLPFNREVTGNTILKSVQLWARFWNDNCDFYAYEPLLKEYAEKGENSFDHAEIRGYARAMTKFLKCCSLSIHYREITALLQTLSLSGLPHYDRQYLTKRILKLMKESKEKNSSLNPDDF
jgi:hypothetical protein